MDLGGLRILNNCPKGHKVIGIYDGDFCVAEVHIPGDTKLKDIELAVIKVMNDLPKL